jgi:hypothetical protein
MLLFGATKMEKESEINDMRAVDYSPEKAGVGGSTPSRGTICSLALSFCQTGENT